MSYAANLGGQNPSVGDVLAGLRTNIDSMKQKLKAWESANEQTEGNTKILESRTTAVVTGGAADKLMEAEMGPKPADYDIRAIVPRRKRSSEPKRLEITQPVLPPTPSTTSSAPPSAQRTPDPANKGKQKAAKPSAKSTKPPLPLKKKPQPNRYREKCC